MSSEHFVKLARGLIIDPRVLEIIKDKGWNKTDHYILPSNFDSTFYQGGEAPKVVLVNKAGIITYAGDPSKIDLEAEINGLLTGEPTKIASVNETEKTEELPKKVDKGVPAETYKKFRSLIKDGSLRQIAELDWQQETDRQPQFYVNLHHEKNYNTHLQCVGANRKKLSISGTLKSSAVEAFDKIFGSLFEDGSQEHIKKKIKVFYTTKIEFGTSCGSCSKTLTNKDAQYLSYQDKKYFCKTCGEKEHDTLTIRC